MDPKAVFVKQKGIVCKEDGDWSGKMEVIDGFSRD
jgi:hypothetical protein